MATSTSPFRIEGKGRGAVGLLLVAAIAAFVIVLYADSFASMAGIWQYSDYRHGALVFPLSAYLMWRLRRPLAEIEIRPCGWSILILAALVSLWFVARAIGVQAAEHLAAVLLIPAAVLAFLGWKFVQRALFPLLFLVAAVPVGDALVPHLMQITADVSSTLLRAAGVPVFREGQFLSLPGGDFEVADVCSGLRFLVAGTMISLLFAYLTYQSYLKRAVFVATVAVAMVVANGVRAFTVMYVASATDMRVLAGRDHVYFGWFLFAVVIAALLYAGTRFADEEPADDSPAPPGPPARARFMPLTLVLGLVMLAATAQPLQKDLGNTWLLLWPAAALLLWALYRRFDASASRTEGGVRTSGYAPYSGAGGVLVLCVAVALLAAGPFAQARQASPERFEASLVALPDIGRCGPPGEWSAAWRPELYQPDVELLGTYRCSGQAVDVLVAVYLNDRQGRELVGNANRLLPREWRRFTSVGEYRLDVGDGRTIDVNEVRVEAPGSSSLVWYWYAAGGQTVTTGASLKLAQAVQWLVHGRSDGRVYLLHTELDGSVDEGRKQLSTAARAAAAWRVVAVEQGRT